MAGLCGGGVHASICGSDMVRALGLTPLSARSRWAVSASASLVRSAPQRLASSCAQSVGRHSSSCGSDLGWCWAAVVGDFEVCSL